MKSHQYFFKKLRFNSKRKYIQSFWYMSWPKKTILIYDSYLLAIFLFFDFFFCFIFSSLGRKVIFFFLNDSLFASNIHIPVWNTPADNAIHVNFLDLWISSGALALSFISLQSHSSHWQRQEEILWRRLYNSQIGKEEKPSQAQNCPASPNPLIK